jgi:endonuclease YncB( thermonuclease family)
VRRALCLCHATALAALLALATAAHGHEVEGLVISVQDGDTLTVLDQAKAQHRVRIAGIDAPEKAQPFGEASKASLAQLAFGKRVAARCHKHDRYGREVCSVYVAERDVGLEQVRNGLAWWYREYAREQTPHDRLTYEGAEREAREARRGLWRDANPQPPAEWRKQHGRSLRTPAA